MVTTESENINYDAPQMRRAIRKLRYTSASFDVVCERVRAEADEIRRRDATPVPMLWPMLWPWDETAQSTETEQERTGR